MALSTRGLEKKGVVGQRGSLEAVTLEGGSKIFGIKLPLDTPSNKLYGYIMTMHKETILHTTMYIIFMCGGRANLHLLIYTTHAQNV